MEIEVLYFDGCPNHKPALERVRQVLAEEGLSAEFLEVNVSEPSIAQKIGFLGSPSIRVNVWMSSRRQEGSAHMA